MAFILRGSILGVAMIGKRNRNDFKFLSFDVDADVRFNLHLVTGMLTQILGHS